MEELLYEILANQQDIKEKLNQCYELLLQINKDTENSVENNAIEIANNVIGDMIANALQSKI